VEAALNQRASYLLQQLPSFFALRWLSSLLVYSLVLKCPSRRFWRAPVGPDRRWCDSFDRDRSNSVRPPLANRSGLAALFPDSAILLNRTGWVLRKCSYATRDQRYE